jgi:hypothetical protein
MDLIASPIILLEDTANLQTVSLEDVLASLKRRRSLRAFELHALETARGRLQQLGVKQK